MNRTRKIVLCGIAAFLVGGGIAEAYAVTSPAPAPVVSKTWALPGGASDNAVVMKWAGQFMKAAGTAHAIRADGPVVHNLLFKSNEGVSDPRLAAGHPLLVIRVDGTDYVDTVAIPVPKGHVVAAQQSVIVIADPADGNFVSATFVGAGDAALAAHWDLAKLGTVVPVEVPASATRRALLQAHGG